MKLFTKAAYTGSTGYPGTLAQAQRTLLWEALQTAGFTDSNRVTVTATGTLTVAQCGLLMGSVAGASITSTLPVAGTAADDAFYILKRLDTSANTWTIAAGAGSTIEGLASTTVPPGGILDLQLPGGSTDWKIIGAAGNPQVLTTGGTLTAYTITPAMPITAYSKDQSFNVLFHVASGLNPTIAVSGLATPPNLVKQLSDGTYANIAAGEIPLNHRSRCTLLSAVQMLVETMPVASASKLIQRRQTVASCAVGGDTTTVTITNATPAVVTDTAHNLQANTPYHFPSTTGALPTGLALNTQYYISATGLTANTFQLSATPGGASIATSSAGSGVHTRQTGLVGLPGQPLLGGAIGGAGFTTSNVSAANPLVVTVANGFDANGAVDLVGRAVANLAWTGYSSNGTWGIFADVAVSGVITPVTGNKPLPIYQSSGNFSTAADQMEFDYTRFIGRVGNGSAAVAATRLCLGEVTVAGGVITAIKWYALNGRARIVQTVAASTTYSLDHNVGGAYQDLDYRLSVDDGTSSYPMALYSIDQTDTGPVYAGVSNLKVTRNTVSFLTGSAGVAVAAGAALFYASASAGTIFVERPW